MKYGNLPSPPLHYERCQYAVNRAHRNGLVEADSDYATAEDNVDVVEGLDPSPTSFLVIGCRTGYELLELQKCYPQARVVGVDIVPDFVEVAKERGVDARVADMHDLPFEDGEFDWIISVGTIEHAYNVQRVANEMMRVAKQYIYVTCEIENDQSWKNVSNFTFIDNHEEWRGLWKGWEIVVDEPSKYSLKLVLRRSHAS